MQYLKKWHIYMITFAVSSVVWGGVLGIYGKYSTAHNWFGFPVIYIALVTLGASAVLAWVLLRERKVKLLDWSLLKIAVVGLILVTLAGILLTEPVHSTNRADSYDYGYSRIGAWLFVVDFWPGRSGGRTVSNSGSSLSGVADNDLGVGILLIVLVAVLVLAAAVVPHFWVVAGAILLGLTAALALWEITKDVDILELVRG